MIVLYSQPEAQRQGKRAKRSLWTAGAALAAALILCTALCFRVNTANAERMLYTVILLFTCAGWIAILLLRLVYFPSAAVSRHMKSILGGEEEELEGNLTLTRDAFQIPKGILVRKAMLTQEDETRTLNLDARYVQQLPPPGTRVRVRIVRKFITAIEVLP